MKKTRAKVLNYIIEHGTQSTVREIAAAVGVKSTNTVFVHLKRLEKDGLIDLREKRAERQFCSAPKITASRKKIDKRVEWVGRMVEAREQGNESEYRKYKKLLIRKMNHA